MRPCLQDLSGRAGQLEPEGGAFALDALEAEPAPVRLDDLARERQAEAGTGDRTRLRRVDTEELREQLRLVLDRNAEPLVAHGHPDEAVSRVGGKLDLA